MSLLHRSAAVCAVLAALASTGAPADESATAADSAGVPQAAAAAAGEGPAVLRAGPGSSDIRGWYAPDESTLIISTFSHGRFKATLAAPCPGIRHADSIGFSTMGPFELDSSTTVVLPDGRRCRFRDLVGYLPGDAETAQPDP